MSKAEEKSREYVLPFLDNHYEKYGERKQMELSRFDGYDVMSAYEEGYYQAEKDLELCWEDLKLLDKIFMNEKIMSGLILEKKEYKEILKRFKEMKEK